MAGAIPGDFIGAARTQWSRRTSRERALLGGLAVAAACALPFFASEWAREQAADAAESQARLGALAAARGGSPVGAQARLLALEGKVRAWTPAAPSFAVARVLVEQEAALAASRAGLTALEVHAAETPDRVGDVEFVRVDLSGAGADWPRLAEVVRRLAEARPGYVVERAASDGTGADARLRLVLLAPFRTSRG